MGTLTAAEKRERRAEAIKDLRELCPPGTTVYTVVHKANYAGTARTMTAFMIEEPRADVAWPQKPRPRRINHYLSNLGIGRLTSEGYLHVTGGGMDMGFSVVHDMASIIYQENETARNSIRQEWL